MLRPSMLVPSLRRLLLVLGISGLAGVLLAGLAIPVIAGVGLTTRTGAETFQERPGDYPEFSAADRSVIFDANGRRLATIYEENRMLVGLDEIAPIMQDAILAIEDDRFYERGPIDFQGTLRALALNVGAGETRAGGSTLTQQYVKLLRLDQAETPEEQAAVQASSGIDGYTRKLDELRMAVNVEKDLTKDQILENYLNLAFFGARAYGVESAARRYFGVGADELQSDQAALLAGLVQSPVALNPLENPDAALTRRNIVLGRMLEVGSLTQEQYDGAVERDLGLDPTSVPNGCVDSVAGFYCDYVVNEVRQMEELGDTPEERETLLRRGGLRIDTALDGDIQSAADDAVRDRVAPTDTAIASTAVVEPATGLIKAISNSRLYGPTGEGRTSINYAVDQDMGGGNGMQNGSSNKIFVLAAAIAEGIPLDRTITAPAGEEYGGEQYTTCVDDQPGTYTIQGSYQPRNSTGGGRSTFDLRSGTEQSINTFYLKLAQETGLCEPATIAEDAGMMAATGGPLQQVPTFPLGVNEVSPLSVTAAYAMFANRGVACAPRAITEVRTADNEVLADRPEDCSRVMRPNDADLVNEVMQGVIDTPGATGARMALEGDRPAAGKTGTTNSSVAVWFAGYTPDLASAVAVADVDGSGPNGQLATLDGRSYNGEVIGSACGGCIPGPIWKSIMDTALEGTDPTAFTAPSSPIGGPQNNDDEEDEPERPRPVPDVRGLTEAEARSALTSNGFEVAIADSVPNDLPEGTVVRTGPGPGRLIDEGETIDLTLSAGRGGGGGTDTTSDEPDENDAGGDPDTGPDTNPPSSDEDPGTGDQGDPSDQGDQGDDDSGDGDDQDTPTDDGDQESTEDGWVN